MKVIKYHTNEGQRVCLLVKRGHKHIHLIPIDAAGLAVKKVPLSEERHFGDLTYRDKPYPQARAIRNFKRCYRIFGGTKAAKAAIYQ